MKQKQALVQSVQDLLRALDEHCPEAEMFRGQVRDWPILPSIGRYPDIADGYDDWRVFHEHIIERFLRYGRPHFASPPAPGAELWVLAQHHGLPTRLIDTTTNPLKALFFALSRPEDDHHDGVFWAFTYDGWREDLDPERAEHWEDQLVAFLPPQLNPRLTAQEGAFLSYPLPANTRPLTPVNDIRQENMRLQKLIVPAASKPRLRRELATLGVQHRLLFPDLDGVALSIKAIELLRE